MQIWLILMGKNFCGEKLSECIDKNDINIVSLLGDGASASILEPTKSQKLYFS